MYSHKLQTGGPNDFEKQSEMSNRSELTFTIMTTMGRKTEKVLINKKRKTDWLRKRQKGIIRSSCVHY